MEAYGQNANFLRDNVITTNTTWNSTLPFVIIGGIRIDTNAILTIDAGVNFFTWQLPVIVDGTIIINGSNTNKVVFTGDRLDEYKDVPAGWPGIHLRRSSKNNIFTHTVIKNAYQAVIVQDPAANTNPKLIMHQCIIDNAYDAGLLCINSSVESDNSLISNCGNGIVIQLGGNYTFTHCTMAAFPILTLRIKHLLLLYQTSQLWMELL